MRNRHETNSMNKFLIGTLLVGFITTTGMSQTKIGDVTLPNSLEAGTTKLTLNGGGIREKLWMDMYVGGLYLQSESNDAEKITKADEPMAIKLHIVSKLISSKKMADAVGEGFEKSTGGKSDQYKKEIAIFKAVFNVEPIQVGDIYDLVYVPDAGVKIYKNEKMLAVIEGLGFKQALWGIWLCDQPADEDLKEGMLGN